MRVSNNVVSSDDLKFHVCGCTCTWRMILKDISMRWSWSMPWYDGTMLVLIVGYVDLNTQESKPDLQPQALSPFSRTQGPRWAKHFFVNFRPRCFQSHWFQSLRLIGALFQHVPNANDTLSLPVAMHLEECKDIDAAVCDSRDTLNLSYLLELLAMNCLHRGFSCRFLTGLIDLRMQDHAGFWNRIVPLPLLPRSANLAQTQAGHFPCDEAANHPRLKIHQARVLTVRASDWLNIIGLHWLPQEGFQITWMIDKRELDEVSLHFPCILYSQKTKSSLISCFCSRAYGESIFQMSSLLSTPHTKCIIWVNLLRESIGKCCAKLDWSTTLLDALPCRLDISNDNFEGSSYIVSVPRLHCKVLQKIETEHCFFWLLTMQNGLVQWNFAKF